MKFVNPVPYVLSWSWLPFLSSSERKYSELVVGCTATTDQYGCEVVYVYVSDDEPVSTEPLGSTVAAEAVAASASTSRTAAAVSINGLFIARSVRPPPGR